MPSRSRRAVAALERADRSIRRTAGDIRLTRRGSGLSQEAAAKSVGLDRSTYGRIERAELPNVTVRQLSLACASVGLEYGGRAYPSDDPARDAGHRRLLDRLRARLPVGTPWQTEVPFPIAADRRAWDAMCELQRRRIGIEAEMRLDDVQALERRTRLKQRDGDVAIVILLVADTRGNRALLGHHREALRATFPLDGRAVLAAIERGRAPHANGIVIL